MAAQEPSFRTWRQGLLSLFSAALLSACSATGPDTKTGSLPGDTAVSKASVKVAVLAPLSSQGPPGLIAKGLKQAAELALFERDNASVQLIVKDDKGTPEGARIAAEESIKDGATLILGPLFAKSVTAVAPVARNAKVPVIAFSNDRQVAGSSVYLLSFQPAPEVERIVAYAAQKGKTRFAALISQDVFGKTVDPVFRSAVTRAGGTIVALETYAINSVLEPTRKISDAIKAAEAQGTPVDALFVPGGLEYLDSIGRLLPMLQIDTTKVQVLGTGGMDYPAITRHKGLIGAWYPGPDPKGFNDFSQKYAKSYGESPPRIASLAYDAVNVASALSSMPADQRFSAANLTRAQGFKGVDGTYRLLPDGTTDRPLAIFAVQKGGVAMIEQAPAEAPAPAVASSDGGGSSLFGNIFNFK
jgi:branched-chain amino acid transport system substrate-binding protein